MNQLMIRTSGRILKIKILSSYMLHPQHMVNQRDALDSAAEDWVEVEELSLTEYQAVGMTLGVNLVLTSVRTTKSCAL